MDDDKLLLLSRLRDNPRDHATWEKVFAIPHRIAVELLRHLDSDEGWENALQWAAHDPAHCGQVLWRATQFGRLQWLLDACQRFGHDQCWGSVHDNVVSEVVFNALLYHSDDTATRALWTLRTPHNINLMLLDDVVGMGIRHSASNLLGDILALCPMGADQHIHWLQMCAQHAVAKTASFDLTHACVARAHALGWDVNEHHRAQALRRLAEGSVFVGAPFDHLLTQLDPWLADDHVVWDDIRKRPHCYPVASTLAQRRMLNAHIQVDERPTTTRRM